MAASSLPFLYQSPSSRRSPTLQDWKCSTDPITNELFMPLHLLAASTFCARLYIELRLGYRLVRRSWKVRTANTEHDVALRMGALHQPLQRCSV